MRAALYRSPALLFRVFGRRAIMAGLIGAAQRLLPPAALAAVLRASMAHLFGWTNARIDRRHRAAVFQHMYSPTSVKQIAHWFQVMAGGRLRRYDGGAPYALERLSTVRTLAVVGGADSLANPDDLRSFLPKDAVHVVHGYEHMDILWADDAASAVHLHVASFLAAS
jgi:lysosomal acid lipase/cholesteryl ester hydrolase